MNRREFLAAIAGVAIAPQILEQLQQLHGTIDRDAFTVDMEMWSSLSIYPRWSAGDPLSTGKPLTMETIQRAQMAIWESPTRVTTYDRRIYERTGLLVPL